MKFYLVGVVLGLAKHRFNVSEYFTIDVCDMGKLVYFVFEITNMSFRERFRNKVPWSSLALSGSQQSKSREISLPKHRWYEPESHIRVNKTRTVSWWHLWLQYQARPVVLGIRYLGCFCTKVFCIFCQNFQVYGILYYNNFRYLLSTFLHFKGILVSQGKEMWYIGIPLPPGRAWIIHLIAQTFAFIKWVDKLNWPPQRALALRHGEFSSGLTIKTSAFNFSTVTNQFTLSTQLIDPNVFHFPADTAPQFLNLETNLLICLLTWLVILTVMIWVMKTKNNSQSVLSGSVPSVSALRRNGLDILTS